MDKPTPKERLEHVIFAIDRIKIKEFPFLKVPSSRINIVVYPLENTLLIKPDFPFISDLLKVVDAVPFDNLLKPELK